MVDLKGGGEGREGVFKKKKSILENKNGEKEEERREGGRDVVSVSGFLHQTLDICFSFGKTKKMSCRFFACAVVFVFPPNSSFFFPLTLRISLSWDRKKKKKKKAFFPLMVDFLNNKTNLEIVLMGYCWKKKPPKKKKKPIIIHFEKKKKELTRISVAYCIQLCSVEVW
ncbi:hypothetical protein [Devosia indica]